MKRKRLESKSRDKKTKKQSQGQEEVPNIRHDNRACARVRKLEVRDQ